MYIQGDAVVDHREDEGIHRRIAVFAGQKCSWEQLGNEA